MKCVSHIEAKTPEPKVWLKANVIELTRVWQIGLGGSGMVFWSRGQLIIRYLLLFLNTAEEDIVIESAICL